MIPRFKKSRFEPKPIETDYWIDLNENEYGGVFKYYDTNAMVWKQTESITKEKEPQFTSSPAYKITTNDIDYWNSKVNYEDFDALKEELLDLGSKFEGVTIETLEYYNDILRSDIDNKADKANTLSGYGIIDAYTKKQIDNKFAEWKVDLPENVSYFKNDVGYVTESNLEEKLPDNIVSDANYVHTDNNFNNEYKGKLDSLSDDLKSIEYDDSEVKRLIQQNTTRINQLQTSIEDDIAATVESMSAEIAKKANADEVYTKTYLDEVFTQFVRKTHKTYGYIDDRPTADLTTSDTGFIFYDYTVNEALLWVADEWRLLRTNEALTNFIKDEDIVKQVTDWEWEEIDDTSFCKLLKYLGEYSSTMDLVVPNTYIDKFVTRVGKDYSDENGGRARYTDVSRVTFTQTDAAGRTAKLSRIIYAEPEHFMAYSVENLKQNPQHTIYNVFGTTVGTVKDVSNVTSEFSLNSITPATVDPISVNTLTISQGIRHIGDGLFANINMTNTVFDIPPGTESIGDFSFYKSNITELTFPRNPIKLGSYSFYDCPLNRIVFPKTLDWDYIINGGSAYCFAKGAAEVDLLLNEGVKAIPPFAFYGTIVKTLSFPDSLEYVGYAAFYNSNSSTDRTPHFDFKAKNLKTIGSWAFRNVNFRSIDLTGVETLNPYAFYFYKTGIDNTCTSFIAGPTLKNIYPCGWPRMMTKCGVSIALPPTLKSVESDVVQGHGRSLATTGIDIEISIPEGVESLGPSSIYNNGFNTTISLPESLKYIGTYALGKNMYLKNESLFIPKNVQVISGMSESYGGVWFYELEEDRELYNKVFPISKNGYCPIQFYDYINDGGPVAEYGHGAFYHFAIFHLKEFIVDPENKWFKSIDGVLFSKDGKRLVAYPVCKGTETYEIPEGCEYADSASFNFTGYKSSWSWENKNGEIEEKTYTYSPGSGIPTDKEITILKTIILPNTFINYSPYEIIEKWPTASTGHNGNILSNMTWWYTHVERILVKDDNPRYKNDGDWLLSKDGTVLQVITPGMKGTYRIPDSVTTIAPGAFQAWNSSSGKSVRSDQTAALVTPTAALANDSYVTRINCMKLIIPPSVVNISELTLYSLNLANKNANFHLVFEEGNPAFKYNSETGNYERV